MIDSRQYRDSQQAIMYRALILLSTILISGGVYAFQMFAHRALVHSYGRQLYATEALIAPPRAAIALSIPISISVLVIGAVAFGWHWLRARSARDHLALLFVLCVQFGIAWAVLFSYMYPQFFSHRPFGSEPTFSFIALMSCLWGFFPVSLAALAYFVYRLLRSWRSDGRIDESTDGQTKQIQATETSVEVEAEALDIDPRHIAVLEFCRLTLIGLELEGGRDAVLWRFNADVVNDLLKLWSITAGRRVTSDYQLSDDEKKMILKSHPLLQRHSFEVDSRPAHGVWYAEMKQKVKAFAQKMSGNE